MSYAPFYDSFPVTNWTWDAMRTAARIARSRTSISPSLVREGDLTAVALSGISMAVATDPDITFRDAVWAGAREIQDSWGATKHHHGTKSTGLMPAFVTYWLDQPPLGNPTRCEERLAVIAVFNALPALHQQTLVALAMTDSVKEAAEMVGVNANTFKWRAKKAREGALALWFDHETAPPLMRLRSHRRGRDRICPAGHSIAGENVMTTRKRNRGRVLERCRICHDADQAKRRTAQSATPKESHR